MAQAEHISTAIRELVSRGQPLKSTNRVRAAHTEFALVGHPENICLAARLSRRPQWRHGPEQPRRRAQPATLPLPGPEIQAQLDKSPQRF